MAVIQTGTVELTASLLGLQFGTSAFFKLIQHTAIVSGTLSSSPVLHSDPEGRLASLGYRPFLPLVIRATGIRYEMNLTAANAQEGDSFLMDAAYLVSTGDGFASFGSGPSFVGTKREGGLYRFRPPADYEVVWCVSRTESGDVEDRGLYRFEDRGWVRYTGPAERAMIAMRVFAENDPTSAYLFFARTLDAVAASMQRDNADLRSLTDAAKVSSRLFGALAQVLAVRVPNRVDTQEWRRAWLRAAATLHRDRGGPATVAAVLALLGFSGYVREVWVDPDASDNFTALENAPDDTLDALLLAGLGGRIHAESGLKGVTGVSERPHGWNGSTVNPAGSVGDYVPSSRVVLHLNTRDGGSLPATLSLEEIAELRDAAVDAIRDYLPAHVDVREMATDATINGTDGAGVTDEVTFSEE